MRGYLITSAVVVLLSACGSSLPKYDYSVEPDPTKSEFIIGVSDRLQITVWENPGLSAALVVRPDGTVTLPLIGDLRAANRTPTQLKNEISTRLKAFIKEESAVVTVAVVEVNSYHFTVSGEVANSSVFSQPHFVTVVEALALAGGFTRFAKRNRVRIIRRGKDGEMRQIPISYDAIANGQHPEMNLVILSGDQIVVP